MDGYAAPVRARARRPRAAGRPAFPFTAVTGQEELRLGLLLAAVDGGIGGVLALGDRGTGKSTTIRALAALLPPIAVNEGCRFTCDPARPAECCPVCHAPGAHRVAAPVPVVDLPLGATEDRVVGALDLEVALSEGRKAFEPGLLARAHRGFLYIDEVNLLEDHLVDLLLDVAASGESVVEREGLSIRHPARFVLVGSGNPEEGELRPQLLDRFGLSAEVTTPTDIPTRVRIIRLREEYEANPARFARRHAAAEAALRARLLAARRRLAKVQVPDAMLELAAKLCLTAGTDGLRGELTLIRAARALAAFEGEAAITPALLRRVAPMALRHRLRRNPLDDSVSTTRVLRALDEVIPA